MLSGLEFSSVTATNLLPINYGNCSDTRVVYIAFGATCSIDRNLHKLAIKRYHGPNTLSCVPRNDQALWGASTRSSLTRLPRTAAARFIVSSVTAT